MRRSIFLGLACMIILIAASPPQVHAQPVQYNHVRIVNKSLAVGKKKATIADTSAILELGDTATGKGLLLPRTDTAKVKGRPAGLLFYNRSDSCLYYSTGRRLRKVTAN